ncbi:amidohydrolase family protein [Actinoplanes sp. CA-015351]|uniref:amidohydrolase family protein n=1 Tax=Actinoplanes sp. CA-015351 TaxID=3239897 RepID=UPI003D994A52
MTQRLFDFHARLAPVAGAEEKLLATLGAAGISRAVVCAGGTIDLVQLSRQLVLGGHVTTDAGNDAVLAAARRSGGRLVPFWFANPHRPAEEYAKRATDFHGLELSPAVHGVPLDDPRTRGLVEVAAGQGHPVYVVCLIRQGCGVRDLAALAGDFPDTAFVLGHSGTGNIDFDAVEVVAPRPNILFETSGGYSSVLAAALRRLGSDRLLFGSEYPLQHPDVELAKFRTLDLPPADWARIAWDNAARVLNLEEPDDTDSV